MVKLFLPYVLTLLICLSAYSQEHAQVSDLTNLTYQDYANLSLPPLADLIESANGSPGVAFFDARKADEMRELKTVRRQWLNYIKVSGNYLYGISNDLSSFQDVNMNIVSKYYDKAQVMYSVGATISLPFVEIFDRKNKISQQKIRVSSVEYERERTLEEISLKLVNAYTDAMQNMSFLKATSEAMTIATAQYKVTETNFLQGKTDAQTLSRQKNIHTQTVREYEQTRAELNNAILRLEILSRQKIINK